MKADRLSKAYEAAWNCFQKDLAILDNAYWRADGTADDRKEATTKAGELIDRYEARLKALLKLAKGLTRRQREAIRIAFDGEISRLRSTLQKRTEWEASTFAFADKADAFVEDELSDILEEA